MKTVKAWASPGHFYGYQQEYRPDKDHRPHAKMVGQEEIALEIYSACGKTINSFGT